MANLTVSVASGNEGIRPVRVGPQDGLVNIGTFIAAEALAAGDLVYLNGSDKLAKCDASADNALAKPIGIVVQGCGAGEGRTVFAAGTFAGYGGVPRGPVYMSNDPGLLADAAGVVSVIVGRGYFKDGVGLIRLQITPR
jgi:hypothetical protein